MPAAYELRRPRRQPLRSHLPDRSLNARETTLDGERSPVLDLTLSASRLRSARSVVAITGAGISAESGLRTFRGGTAASASDLPKDMQTLWAEFDPQTLATPEAFEADPARVSRWYDWRRLCCLAAEPNPGHLALAAIERSVTSAGGRFTLLTQNVDRLHHRAGSSNVVELHGNIIQWRCTSTHRVVDLSAEPFPSFPPPSPFMSGALLRPHVVWFGEMLPPEALEAAADAVQSCDLFLSIGTSAVVYPAAGFLHAARQNNAFTIEINAEPTAASRVVDVCIQGKSGEVLPALAGRAFADLAK
ncbi:MAG: NAD-dependent deacylase [Phycisphaeraceae bacterium]|nr:NAD-dependent deacylase [Phycisphaeraceae bacterium]